MKKIFFSALTCTAIVTTITIYSCKKETVAQPQNSANDFNVSVIDNRLAFKTVEDYEKAMSNPTAETETKFLSTIKTITSSTSFNTTNNEHKDTRGVNTDMRPLIQSDYFRSILNSDCAVQIEDFIFRVNPISKKVFVLPVEYKNEYNDLISENTTNEDVQEFSTDENVLEEVYSDQNAQRKIRWPKLKIKIKIKFCHESGVDSRSQGVTTVLIGGEYTVSFVISHNKYGIYFELRAYSSSTVGYGSFVHEWEVFYYHVRCASTVSYTNISNGSTTGVSEYKQKIYSGLLNLNSYRLKGKCKHYSNTIFGGSTYDGETPVIEIRVNI